MFPSRLIYVVAPFPHSVQRGDVIEEELLQQSCVGVVEDWPKGTETVVTHHQ